MRQEFFLTQNDYHLEDVLIVGRGGGSIEDLWAFNEEVVAWAIYRSDIPVISAVGHEPDVTISDYVADLRAATPSNAAELAVPDQDALRQTLDTMQEAMSAAVLRQIRSARTYLRALSAGSALKGPTAYIENRKQAIDILQNRMISGYNKQLFAKKQKFLMNTAKLDAMSPLRVLSRGYSVTRLQSGEVVTSRHQVKNNDPISVTLRDGTIQAIVKEQDDE